MVGDGRQGGTGESDGVGRAAGPLGRAVRRLPRLDWSYEALVALLIGAEASVLYLCTAALFGSVATAEGLASPPTLFALLLLGTNIQRAMEAYRLWSPEYEIVATLALALTLAGALRLIAFPHYPPGAVGWVVEAARGLALFPTTAARPVWAVVLLVAYAWWRGRARHDPGLDAAYGTLRVGTVVSVAALLIALALVTAGGGRTLPRPFYGVTIIFLGCALASIALARLRIEQARGALTLTPRWLATFLGPVVALLVSGAVLAGLFTRRLLDSVLWLLRPLLLVVQFLLLIFVYLATALVWLIFIVFTWIISRLGLNPGTPTPGAGTPQVPPTPQRFDEIGSIATPDPLRYLIAGALLLALVWALTRFLWRRRRRPTATAGETRESVFSWDLLGAGAANLLRTLRGRLHRRSDPLAHLRGDPRWRHTLAIRETYRRLLRRGAAADLPRAPGQTPDEYAPDLGKRFALARSAVTTLTARYDDARYSDRPATAEEAAAARAAWEAFGSKGEGRGP